MDESQAVMLARIDERTKSTDEMVKMIREAILADREMVRESFDRIEDRYVTKAVFDESIANLKRTMYGALATASTVILGFLSKQLGLF